MYNVHVQCKFHAFCFLFLLVQLYQTIPEQGPVCPGEKLRYVCTSTQRPISWSIDESSPVFFGESDDDVNTTETLGNFLAVLTVQNESISSSTATNYMVASSYDGQEIQCFGGSFFPASITINVAGTVCSVTGDTTLIKSCDCISSFSSFA